jgi:hypothetical protein
MCIHRLLDQKGSALPKFEKIPGFLQKCEKLSAEFFKFCCKLWQKRVFKLSPPFF